MTGAHSTERIWHSGRLCWRLNRESAIASADSTARRSSTTRLTSAMLSRSGPAGATPRYCFARRIIRRDCGSASSTQPRSARGKIASTPSSSRGSTSSSDSDAPIARARPTNARSLASACTARSPSATPETSCWVRITELPASSSSTSVPAAPVTAIVASRESSAQR